MVWSYDVTFIILEATQKIPSLWDYGVRHYPFKVLNKQLSVVPLKQVGFESWAQGWLQVKLGLSFNNEI